MTEKKKEQQINILNLEVGNRLKNIRKKKGFDQGELASGIGLTRTSIVNIEKGKQSLTIENLLKACAILDCKPTDILPVPPKVAMKKLSKVKKVVQERLLDVTFKW